MLLNVLAVGDVCGEGGQDILARRLKELREGEDIHFTVVNGENASVVGSPPGRPGGSMTPGPMWSPWATTPGTAFRSRIFWRRTAISSARPTTPAGCPAGASGSTTGPGG